MNHPESTILITTRNRKEELRSALRSAVTQTALPEVLVIDDGSTDGTAEMIRTEFPSVRLERREESRGLIVRRNEGARLARSPIIFSIDDDAEFTAPDSIAVALEEFNHPRIGAVAIPFINVRQSSHIFQKPTPGGSEIQVAASYIGTAHAMRREVFIALGGYKEHFIHQGEEGDFCLRMLAAGYVVRLGRSAPIHHHESPKRDTRRMDFFGRRNDVLFAMQNVPAKNLPAHLGGTLINGLRAAARSQHPMQQLSGLAEGLSVGICRWNSDRAPVAYNTYRLHRRLKKNGPLPLEEIEGFLPPLLSTTISATADSNTSK